MDTTTQEILLKAKKIITLNPQIQGAYLYGSYAKRTNRTDSDIDIAIYGNNISTDLILQLTDQLESELDKKVQMVILSKDTDLTFAKQIITYNIPIFYKDLAQKNQNEIIIAQKFYDQEYLRNLAYQQNKKYLGII